MHYRLHLKQAVLCILNFKPCDHFNEIFEQPVKAVYWNNTFDVYLQSLTSGLLIFKETRVICDKYMFLRP